MPLAPLVGFISILFQWPIGSAAWVENRPDCHMNVVCGGFFLEDCDYLASSVCWFQINIFGEFIGFYRICLRLISPLPPPCSHTDCTSRVRPNKLWKLTCNLKVIISDIIISTFLMFVAWVYPCLASSPLLDIWSRYVNDKWMLLRYCRRPSVVTASAVDHLSTIRLPETQTSGLVIQDCPSGDDLSTGAQSFPMIW